MATTLGSLENDTITKCMVGVVFEFANFFFLLILERFSYLMEFLINGPG